MSTKWFFIGLGAAVLLAAGYWWIVAITGALAYAWRHV